MRRIRRLATLSTGERWLLIRAFVALGATDIALQIHGFQQLIVRLELAKQLAREEVSPDEVVRAQDYAHWLEVASRYHPVRARCLHRSLTLHGWLVGEGIPSVLRLGVRKDGQELKAHAWVEIDGRVVSDEPAAILPFKPLARGAEALLQEGSQMIRSRALQW